MGEAAELRAEAADLERRADDLEKCAQQARDLAESGSELAGPLAERAHSDQMWSGPYATSVTMALDDIDGDCDAVCGDLSDAATAWSQQVSRLRNQAEETRAEATRAENRERTGTGGMVPQ